MREKISKFFQGKNLKNYIILLIITSILSLPMLKSNIDIYADDGIQHIARAYGTYESMKQNGFFTGIISNFSNNFGYSWNLFYGPLTTYGLLIIHLFFDSFIVSYKIFTYICLFLSSITMYKLVKKITNENNVALVSGAIYLSFPYHLTDLYTRNALGEFVSFIFIPLVFLGLYEIINENDKSSNLAIGTIGLILTHNISVMYTAIFAFFYCLLNFKKIINKNILKKILLNILFIILITSFYWLPLIQTKIMCNYHVYEKDAMSTPESVNSHRLSINQLFVTKNDGSYVFELGPHIIIMLAFSLLVIKSLEKNKKEYLFFIISGIICLIMSSKLFPWNFMPSFLCLIQFPWRLIAFASFFFSIVCSINMFKIIKNYNFIDALIIITICIIYTISLKNLILKYDQINNIDSYNLGFISGMEYEVIIGEGKGEYLPEKAYNNRFYIATREDVIYVLKGKAIIEDEKKNGNNLTARIKTVEEETIFELPYLYYPGYEITADGIKISSFETENGFLGIELNPNDSVRLDVNYNGTELMKISLVISLFSLILFVAIVIV